MGLWSGSQVIIVRSAGSDREAPEQRRKQWPVLVLLATLAATAQAQSDHPRDLTEATLEDLMNVEVTSVGKKQQKLSRAIRPPARFDTGLELNVKTVSLENGGFALILLRGAKNAKAETLLNYEIGYRAQVNHRLSIDGTSYIRVYHGLQTGEPEALYFTLDLAPPHLVLPLGYNTPKYQFQVRSFLNLPLNFAWDSSISTVAKLRNGGDGLTPGYTRLDTRLGWQLGESIEFSVVGQNLLQSKHAEFHDVIPLNHTLVERNVYGKVTWRS
jgi:hypothetical protein